MTVSRRLTRGVVVLGTAAVVLSGCARAAHPPSRSAVSAGTRTQVRPAATAAQPVPPAALCPHGTLLGPGQGMAIDYVDFVEIGGIMFVAAPGVGASASKPPLRLGRVVARVRCSLLGSPTDRNEPPLVEGTAAFLPVGTELYSVLGLPLPAGLRRLPGPRYGCTWPSRRSLQR